ncbi:hypothetical protein [Chitinophaga nivalis]|uniref:DUF1682 domain-containing protein n=1 Tax=Chitinophaga nivalis TaxID=2991709 RepID=A0ABT3ITC3_9BACT|nr:hypothetical protein [Chitinophaga nivalis]MCW3463340.1 hypothetical protein [Chitinophaga nivalis]MCW3486970.1 hypothetical protein [Chitinophaga nivalis]
MGNEFNRRKGRGVAKFLVLGILFIAVVGLATQFLWNALIPELFHGPVITFWQALGLLLLGKLLFGWHNHHRSWGDKWNRNREWKTRIKERMSHMTPEEQAKMREHFRNRCGRGFNSWYRNGWDACEPEDQEKPTKKED